MKTWKHGMLMAIVGIFGMFVGFTACKGKNESTGGTSSKIMVNATVNALKTAIQNNNKEAVVEAARSIEPEAYLDAINQGMPLWAFAESIKGISPAVINHLVKNKAAPSSNFTYDLNKEGNGIIIKKHTGNGSYIIFPPEIEGYPVVQIGAGDLSHITDKKNSLQFVVIPEGVKKIGGTTFYEQALLVSAAFPSTLVEIGDMAFWRTSLQQVDLSHTVLTTIGYSAFQGDWNKSTEIISVKLPDTVTTIKHNAFAYNNKLTSINIPANIKTIEDLVFFNCGELNNLTIPDSITTIKWVSTGTSGGIPYEAFQGCGKLPIRTRQRLQELGYRWSF
jgi:pectate lyase